MKKILITGKDSYIGTYFENYINKNFDGYEIDVVDMLNPDWKAKSFSGYDAVFHVAGIAHLDTAGTDSEVKAKYERVNTQLAVETAQKAKADGVGQFIFMSSIIVYGSKNEFITKDTVPAPDNFYGLSKLRADEQIHRLCDENFKTASVRSPMIYGKGSKGNYPRLSKLAKKIPIFPDFDNQRSMIYIENLCECVRFIIDRDESGFFYPQNREYVKTSELVKCINPKIKTTHIFNGLIKRMKNINTVRKVFGNLVYDKEMSDCFDYKYCIKNLRESVKETEGKFE